MGYSEKFRIMAYGNRKYVDNLRGNPNAAESQQARWFPSSMENLTAILHAVAQNVTTDGPSEPLDPHVITSEGFRKLDKLVTGKDAGGAPAWQPKRLYEMLLRVDGVVEDGEHGAWPIVYESPLWVARDNRPVPGTYEVTGHDEPDATALASWDGRDWSDLRWKTQCRQAELRWMPERSSLTDDRLPPMPVGPPTDAEVLVDLAIRASEDSSTIQPDTKPGWPVWLRNKLGLGKRTPDRSGPE